MRALLSTVGTRGDVQPLLALALALRELGHEATLVAPPDFADWVTAHGVAFVGVGPSLRALPPATPGPQPVFTPEQRRAFAGMAVHGQFQALGEAARGHDVVVAATVVQYAARSIAEARGVPYVFAAYCPAVLPSSQHPPARIGPAHPLDLPASENRASWAEEARQWDDLFGAAIAEEREKLGLAPIDAVMRHILSPAPWLAADPLLGPAAPADGLEVLQTGAWRLAERAALPAAVEAFLEAGPPPVYLGFGSMRAGADVGRVLLAATRALGRRAVVSRGWGGLAPDDAGDDWIAVDDLPHDALFPRVAAVVHHGGAGTTTAAATAGRPQVVVPHQYDQPYWAHRVDTLGLGAALPPGRPAETDAVAAALEAAMRPDVTARAEHIASRIVRDGAHVAAERLVRLVG